MAINLFCWHFWYFSAFQDFLANFNFDANMLWPTSKLIHSNIYLLQTGALSNKCSQVFPIPKWHTSVTNNILSIMTTGAQKFCNSQATSKGAMTQPPFPLFGQHQLFSSAMPMVCKALFSTVLHANSNVHTMHIMLCNNVLCGAMVCHALCRLCIARHSVH